MMHDKDDAEILTWILIALVAVVAIAFIGYWLLFGFLWIAPWALFTAVTLAVITAVVWFCMILICGISFKNIFKGISAEDNVKLQPVKLAVIFPILVIAVYCIFGVPTRMKGIDSIAINYGFRGVSPDVNTGRRALKTRVVTVNDITIESPALVEAFNLLHSKWQNKFSLGRRDPYEPVIYDWRMIAAIAWFSLLVTGPAFFWRSAIHTLKLEEEERAREYRRMSDFEKKKYEAKYEQSLRKWQRREEDLEKSCRINKEKNENLELENEVLKVKLALSKSGQDVKIAEARQKRGVLDGDFL